MHSYWGEQGESFREKISRLQYLNQHRVQRLHTNLPAPIYLCHQWSQEVTSPCIRGLPLISGVRLMWTSSLSLRCFYNWRTRTVRNMIWGLKKWWSESPIDYVKHHSNSSSSKRRIEINFIIVVHFRRMCDWLTLRQESSLRSSPIRENLSESKPELVVDARCARRIRLSQGLSPVRPTNSAFTRAVRHVANLESSSTCITKLDDVPGIYKGES